MCAVLNLSILIPSSLGRRLTPLKKRGSSEPGNIHCKSCRLPPSATGGTNQIAERNHMKTRILGCVGGLLKRGLCSLPLD